jgi:hypothetical protein
MWSSSRAFAFKHGGQCSKVGKEVLDVRSRLGYQLALNLLLGVPDAVECVGKLELDATGHDMGVVEERVRLWAGYKLRYSNDSV